MDYLDAAQEVIDNMLGYLGFVVTIEIDRESRTLNVTSGDPKILIGHRGERLEDIQYLANRIVQDRIKDAPKFRVDVDTTVELAATRAWLPMQSEHPGISVRAPACA